MGIKLLIEVYERTVKAKRDAEYLIAWAEGFVATVSALDKASKR